MHLHHVKWEILAKPDGPASEQGWLRVNLIHCAYAAPPNMNSNVHVYVRSNLVATASSGKWRLLNTRAKAPSWEEKDIEETQSLH